MVTDLRSALRDAAAAEPPDDVDVLAALMAGKHRLQRRRRAFAGAAAAAAVLIGVATLVVTSALTGPHRRVNPVPAGPPPLTVPHIIDFSSARKMQPEVLTSTRTLWLNPAKQLDTDRFVGLTDDGLVVRTRFTAKNVGTEVALVDPTHRRTTWLPRPNPGVGELRAVSLTKSRLVFLLGRHAITDAVLTFDRSTNTWHEHAITGTDTLDRFFGWQARLGPDDRIYLASSEPPLRWWSIDMASGPLVREPSLDGQMVAWQGSERASVDSTGLVQVIRGSQRLVLAKRAPRGCTQPADSATLAPSMVYYSGSILLVGFSCVEGRQLVAFDAAGAPVSAVPARAVTDLAVSSDGALFAVGDRQELYFFQPSTSRLWSLGRGLHEEGIHTADGLLLWNEPGPKDSDQVMDIVYQVAPRP